MLKIFILSLVIVVSITFATVLCAQIKPVARIELDSISTNSTFSSDGKLFANYIAWKGIELWDLESKSNIAMFEIPGKPDVECLAFSPDNKLLVSGGFQGTINFWDIASKRNIATFEGHHRFVISLAFSPDGKWLASGASHFERPDESLKLWDVASRNRIPLHDAGALEVGSVWCLAFSPDNKLLVSGGSDGMINFWDIKSKNHIDVFEGHRRSVVSLVLSPDGKLLACSSGWDTTIKLWDVASKSNIATLEGHQEVVGCLDFSPDGELLASGSYDTTIKLWDVASKSNIATLEGHQDNAEYLAFSPDGQLLATAGWDDRILFWDISAISRGVPAKKPEIPKSGQLVTSQGKLAVTWGKVKEAN